MKIMLLVSHRLEDDILKVIEPNIFYRSSFTHISFKRVVKVQMIRNGRLGCVQ
jgi:hypothetical protein